MTDILEAKKDKRHKFPIRYERADITTDSMCVNRIISEYYEHPNACILKKSKKLTNYLKTTNYQSHLKRNNLQSPKIIKQIKYSVKNFFGKGISRPRLLYW